MNEIQQFPVMPHNERDFKILKMSLISLCFSEKLLRRILGFYTFIIGNTITQRKPVNRETDKRDILLNGTKLWKRIRI